MCICIYICTCTPHICMFLCMCIYIYMYTGPPTSKKTDASFKDVQFFHLRVLGRSARRNSWRTFSISRRVTWTRSGLSWLPDPQSHVGGTSGAHGKTEWEDRPQAMYFGRRWLWLPTGLWMARIHLYSLGWFCAWCDICLCFFYLECEDWLGIVKPVFCMLSWPMCFLHMGALKRYIYIMHFFVLELFSEGFSKSFWDRKRAALSSASTNVTDSCQGPVRPPGDKQVGKLMLQGLLWPQGGKQNTRFVDDDWKVC